MGMQPWYSAPRQPSYQRGLDWNRCYPGGVCTLDLDKNRSGMWVGILWGMLSRRYKNLASSMIRIMPDDARWIVNTVYIVFACMHIYTSCYTSYRKACCLILHNPMSGLRILRVNSEIHSPSVLQAYSGHQIFGEVLAHSCPCDYHRRHLAAHVGRLSPICCRWIDLAFDDECFCLSHDVGIVRFV